VRPGEDRQWTCLLAGVGRLIGLDAFRPCHSQRGHAAAGASELALAASSLLNRLAYEGSPHALCSMSPRLPEELCPSTPMISTFVVAEELIPQNHRSSVWLISDRKMRVLELGTRSGAGEMGIGELGRGALSGSVDSRPNLPPTRSDRIAYGQPWSALSGKQPEAAPGTT